MWLERSQSFRLIFAAGVLVLTLWNAAAQEPAAPAVALTLTEVVNLAKSGLSEDLIIARIKRANKPFDLNGEEILELKRAGVSDNIIRYLFDPTLPVVPAPPPARAPVSPPSEPPKDPLMLKVPPEPGLYWLSSQEPGTETFNLIELKPMVPLKWASGVVSKLPAIGKGHTVGFFVSPAAPLRIGEGPNVFFARLDPKTAIDDIILLNLTKEATRRTLDFGPKPDKPVFPPAALRTFESKRLAEGFYRIDAGPLAPGEYVFLILGSGDPKKGILGKGYDIASGPPGKGK